MVWCDNCLLLFPLSGGAAALNFIIMLYSLAGSIFLFMRGEFFYFTEYEYDVYGGVGMLVAFIALIATLAHANSSYLWTRVVFYVSPFVLILALIRAGAMIGRLEYFGSDITWECDHGGQVYNATIALNETWITTAPDGATTIPSQFCTFGLHATELAFALVLVVDAILQIYAYFLVWRQKAKLEQYFRFSAQSAIGMYKA